MAGERITPLVELKNIDRVPVSVVHPVFDRRCSTAHAEYTYSQIASKEKYIRFELGNHLIFSFKATRDYIDRMVETIETGTVSKSHTSLSPLGLKNFFEVIITMLFDFFWASFYPYTV